MLPKRLILLSFALLLTLAACGDDNDSVDAGSRADGDTDLPAVDDAADTDGSNAAGGGATRPWISGDWVLQAMTVGGADVTIPATATLDLTITGPDAINGNAGCNSFGGVISAPFDDDRDGGSLAIDDLFITEMGCDILDFEGQYVDALLATTEWELAPPSGLVFRGDGVELTYGIGVPPAEVEFENSQWLFDTIYDGEGVNRTASTTRADKPQVTAVFTNGTVTLTAEDCGPLTFDAVYDAGADGQISVAEVDIDGGLCEDAESNMIAAVQGLATSTSYQIFDGRLTFIGLPGETISFIAADG